MPLSALSRMLFRHPWLEGRVKRKFLNARLLILNGRGFSIFATAVEICGDGIRFRWAQIVMPIPPLGEEVGAISRAEVFDKSLAS